MTLAGANGPRYRYKELGIQTLGGLSRIAGGVVTLSPSEDPQQPLISSTVPPIYSIRTQIVLLGHFPPRPGICSCIGLPVHANPAKRTSSFWWPFGALLNGREATDNLKTAWGDSRNRSKLVCFAYWDVGATKVTVCEPGRPGSEALLRKHAG
jgi:hypothetical protein